MDFLYRDGSSCGLKYVLVIKDDLSSYSWLHSCCSADGDAATVTLSNWDLVFCQSMKWLISDRVPQFTASLMKNLTKNVHVRLHLSTACSPWANRTVERLCKEVICSVRVLLLELKLLLLEWPSVIEEGQAIINQSPLKRFRKKVQTDATMFSAVLWRCSLVLKHHAHFDLSIKKA